VIAIQSSMRLKRWSLKGTYYIENAWGLSRLLYYLLHLLLPRVLGEDREKYCTDYFNGIDIIQYAVLTSMCLDAFWIIHRF
jgi:hypothetical protein